jgi:uncharacterized ion transporter superfamily protein YfcC
MKVINLVLQLSIPYLIKYKVHIWFIQTVIETCKKKKKKKMSDHVTTQMEDNNNKKKKKKKNNFFLFSNPFVLCLFSFFHFERKKK